MNESKFQGKLIRRIRERYPDCIVLKNDPDYIQGIPDLIILNKGTWAALECKRAADAKHRPNQDYYVEKMSVLSYANFVYPENEEEIIEDLDRVFGVS